MEKQDLENLIGEEEGLKREFKAAAAFHDKFKISKVVSSFANAQGGIFYIGIKENPNTHKAEQLDPIDNSDGKHSKEKLEQTIQSNIFPPLYSPPKITPVEVKENHYIYVIDIPEAHTAHQAADKKYYSRDNFTTRALYDHEIELIKAKQKRPILEPEFKCERSNTLRLFLYNRSYYPAKNVQINLKPQYKRRNGQISLSLYSDSVFQQFGNTFQKDPGEIPNLIYDMTHRSIGTFKVDFTGTLPINLEVYAENMRHKCFHFSLSRERAAKFFRLDCRVIEGSYELEIDTKCRF